MRQSPSSAFSSRSRLNPDMGDAPDGTPITAILRNGEAVRVELYANGHDEPLLFASSDRLYAADEFDGWIVEADEAGLYPLYADPSDFDDGVSAGWEVL